ncbi:MAG TPA: hypothetical protein VFS21_11585 [Roseiflexaceae bacterium]|nr:hypothetical protein [Roseiflexaceae bacterium]
MPWIFELVKWTHVVAACLSLAAAPVAIATRKGGRVHRLAGRVYVWGMTAVFITALIMSIYRPVIFLVGVAVLSFYSMFSADRVLAQKRGQLGRFDWVAAGVALAMGVAVVGWGLAMQVGAIEGPALFGVLGMVFGGMTAGQAAQDMRRFRQPPTDRLYWWYFHMDRMLGSFTGLLTALLVQTVGPRLLEAGMSPDLIWVVWIAPTVVMAPTIAFWMGYYRRMFTQRAALRTAAADA